MKKKGFTLIELLAVIVILAIIALIATPLVLKYIEKSRKESKVDSAYSYVRNLETEIANYSIKNNGKKYNKSGLLEIGDLTDIDTTVKGDTPSNGKVCLSSLGQVEKAMFEYGKYYVSYDGKKGSISDKDTYDSFSCNSNVAGGSNSFEFECTESSGCLADLTTEEFDKIFSEIKNATYYNIVIGNQTFNNLFSVISLDDYDFGGDVIFFYEVNGELRGIMSFSDKIFQFVPDITSIEIGKKYSGKLEESTDIAIKNVMRINSSPYANLYGYDFVEGDAHILIKDSEGVEYLNINIPFKSMGFTGLYGTRFDDVDYDEALKNVYNAMLNEKIITVEVTQNGVTTSIGGEKATYDGSQYYYIGNNAVHHAD